MQQKQRFSQLLHLMFDFFKLSLVMLLLMSLLRVYLFLNYGNGATYTTSELFNAFFLGLRLDLSILASVMLLATLLIWFFYTIRVKFTRWIYIFFRLYYIVFLSIIVFCSIADVVYFSYFGEHATLMIFGVIDDDTKALFHTALQNYNIPLQSFLAVVFFGGLYTLVIKMITEKPFKAIEWSWFKKILFFLFSIFILAFLARGTFGAYPLSRYIPDVSTDPFINNLPQTPTHAIINSYNHYKKSKSGKNSFIKKFGFKNNMAKAFEIHTQKKDINTTDLLQNITYITPRNQKLREMPPHVVVVMVESFGTPILKYQSESFNIMGALEKHFKEDTLFTRFISAANGTIVSLEPVLLNITALPNSIAFAQSMYLNTSFSQASAKVYQDAGYETSFVYGGDLSWRNVGSFLSRQGFDNLEGRGAIAASLGKSIESLSHEWGIFDQYLYKYVYEKLSKATTPQFIFILTTNNHPPHIIPKEYVSKKLEISKELREHITGDLDLAKKRFKDYAYALDSLGHFMDRVKGSHLAKDTLVAITADNNTIEGIMHYDDYLNETKKIPFYLYMPEYIKPKKKIDTSLASSHKDMFPTLYNLTLSEQKYRAIGTNLLDKEHIHCGFNSAGVIMASDGAFKFNKPKTQAQKECQEYYKATLAVTEYLIESNLKNVNKK